MCGPLFRNFEATVSNNVYCLHHPALITNRIVFLPTTIKMRCFTLVLRGDALDEMHSLQSVETERKFKRVIQTERQ